MNHCKEDTTGAAAQILHKKQRRSASADICMIQGIHYPRYQATTQFMDLRMYTCEQPTKEAALEDQRILTQLRATLLELEARDPEGWHHIAATACEEVLA